MAKQPKPGERGGTRWGYEGWEAAYDGEKYVDVTALAEERQRKSLPKRNTLKPQFGKKGLKDGEPAQDAGDIVRKLREEMRAKQKPRGLFRR